MFGIGTDAAFLPAVQAHWRAGTGGAANILDSDPTAATDVISFLRTVDDRTPPLPAADLAPNDSDVRGRGGALRLPEGGAARHARARWHSP